MAEAAMEQKLIDSLTKGTNQWVLREDLKNVPQLWNNFFRILSANNKAKLADIALTENEKQTIKTQIIQPTFYRAAEFMSGANGQVRFHLKRDDSTLPDADLLILDNSNISGGSSVYEVVHQVEVPKGMALDQDRRFDVTLLINGLPMIHIELKAPQQPYMKAFNQINKYISEGKFTDIFCFVEMFVVTNGTSTRYISAGGQLNPKFLTSWVDEQNKLVDNYLDFSREVLSIPAAHHMIADYTVLDSEAKNIILLRPYQIHAIEAIFKASRERQSGFIWHTTGSGKTLTSYKVARNLLQLPSIQKTIFLIDRKDLDAQTTGAFQTYANNDTISVKETKNSYDLADQLVDGNRTVVVTTRQKLKTIFKRIEENPGLSKKYEKLKSLNLAFIVDECHRTVTPTQKRELDKFFNRQPLWYGFTGTPIFDENARAENGKDARTTEQLYGPILHEYTIKDALRDKAVLGFKTDNLGDSKEEKADEADTHGLDQVYLSDQHMRAVVEKILYLAYRKQGLINGHRYSAIFTTSSIKQAQRYYSLFKDVIEQGGVPKRIKEVAPDFPRIAVTYSISENDDDSEVDQEAMKHSMADYNAMFHTNYSMAELGSYNRNVNDRLARKKKPYQAPHQQLDIVIVVDRLLTGFDSPNLSTLYVDRRPMNPQNIIQAFSRTNRIYDSGKAWGQIVTFQYPEAFSEAIDDALRLYSHGGSNDVLAPTWKVARKRYVKARKTFDKYLQPDSLQSIENAPKKDRKQFVKDFQELDKHTAAIQTYDELDNQSELPEEEQLNMPEISEEKMDELRGTYENVLESLKKDPPIDDDESEINDDYELESFHIKEINERYIVALIQAYVPDEDNQSSEMNQDDVNEINGYINDLGKKNEKLADIMRSLWKKIQDDPERYRGQQVDQILESMVDDESQKLMKDFANQYQLKYDNFKYVMAHYNPESDKQQQGMLDLLDKMSYNRFKSFNPNSETSNMLKWKKHVKAEIKEYFTDKIQPLIDRSN
ncbi:type I restriction endonuclease subunit R [Lactobacillus sp. LC28-10]|uniref:Type I restriction enzyme endonuclease subunit n=1 Tax=Secundilactobacillus angelensis TaxID=2722706 RepID=A0ABX1KYT1_9LACO|nr:HsdR family type I site-specific deoxyribonuclease [Secundilactobacillus angelensis]MCH5462740.1 HsdR family type I site-specific deoxyribonuclease [Secundilactobacillus angelensis]NLR19106.1 type I restriction endonuclease subunit R [Secundilactobacillus angelensis]